MEYTKGEWRATSFEVITDSATIADCVLGQSRQPDITMKECIANAQLISAAPDMYEALKEIWGASLGADTLRVLQPWFKKVEQALSKAEGRV